MKLFLIWNFDALSDDGFINIKSVEYGNDDEVFLILNIIVGL